MTHPLPRWYRHRNRPRRNPARAWLNRYRAGDVDPEHALWEAEMFKPLRFGSCCYNVGTPECRCEKPSNWGIPKLTAAEGDAFWQALFGPDGHTNGHTGEVGSPYEDEV